MSKPLEEGAFGSDLDTTCHRSAAKDFCHMLGGRGEEAIKEALSYVALKKDKTLRPDDLEGVTSVTVTLSRSFGKVVLDEDKLLQDFRVAWSHPSKRRELVKRLGGFHRPARLSDMGEFVERYREALKERLSRQKMSSGYTVVFSGEAGVWQADFRVECVSLSSGAAVARKKLGLFDDPYE